MAKLRKISQEELNEIIENHQHYLNKDCDGWESMKADLRFMDLSYLDLSHKDLRYADLRYANLSHADLSYADLSYVDLSHSDLSYADLSYVDLSYANLFYADLFYAKLCHVILTFAFLYHTDLTNVQHDNSVSFSPAQFPEKEPVIGYKRQDEKIIKLQIEE